MGVGFSIFLILISAFFLVLIVLYFLQERLIFYPEKLPKDYQFTFKNNFEEVNLQTEDGYTLNGVLFKVLNSRGLLLIFHNHSGNVLSLSNVAIIYNGLQFDVLVIDYRGFGKSTGKFNEKLMLSDSLICYEYAKSLYPEDEITVMGRGIGATFATYVASENTPKRLIIASPMYNTEYTSKRLYPLVPASIVSRYKFDTAKYIRDVNCKIYIFHGKLDKLIHYSNSEKLYELAKDKTKLYLISDTDHYNMIGNKKIFNRLKEIFNS